MKHKFLHILVLSLMSVLVATDAFAWGESTSYVLDAPTEYTLNTIETGPSLALSGPGATLTFQAKKTWAGASGLYIQTSTDGGNNWNELSYINSSLSTSYNSFTYDIDTNVTHIRFLTKTGSTLRKYYKDVKVTRATTLSTSTTTLDFGTITNRRSSTLNALIDYNNTTYNQQVTGTCTDPNFTITSTTVGATGDGQEIPVTFTPTSAGTHTGTVTLTMNGKTVTFQVTGVGQTTYYTRATASATTGGSAYVSFTSFEAATNTSDTKNSGVTTASNASAIAYYRAVPNQRYAFVGWKSNLSDANYVSTDAEFQTPAYTYNSESSTTPTVVTYYAVFEEKPNVITLEPTSSDYDADLYEQVTLHRTFAEGYSTIALPFATTVSELTNRSNDNDWIAQLSAVTYNQHDGFTLFFQKKTNGRITAFEPYILHLGSQVVDPSWTNIELTAASPVTMSASAGYGAAAIPGGTSTFTDWSMTSNFTAGMDMNGKYGIVNAAGGLKLGGSGSTLNAFTAYITSPAGSAGVKTRSAFIDEDGIVTVVEGLPFEALGEPLSLNTQPSTTIYGLDGKRRQNLGRGINILRLPDGSVRKVYR